VPLLWSALALPAPFSAEAGFGDNKAEAELPHSKSSAGILLFSRRRDGGASSGGVPAAVFSTTMRHRRYRRKQSFRTPRGAGHKTRPYRTNSAKLSRAAVNEVERSTTRLKVRLPGIGW